MSTNCCVFLANKYGNKYNDKKLKMILTNFYPQEEILKAKETLMKDIELINPDKWTRPGHKRDSDLSQRASKEVGDIISSWRLLDENGLIDKLPKYVALDLTNTPPVRMEEGEFKLLFNKVSTMAQKMEDQYESIGACFEQLGSQLSITSDIASSLKEFSHVMNTVHNEIVQCHNTVSACANQSVKSSNILSMDTCLQSDTPDSWYVDSLRAECSDLNRESRLKSNRDETSQGSDGDVDDGEGYNVFLNKRSQRKRRKFELNSANVGQKENNMPSYSQQLTLGRPGGWIPPPLAFFPCNFFDESNHKNRLSVSVTRDGRHILTYVASS